MSPLEWMEKKKFKVTNATINIKIFDNFINIDDTFRVQSNNRIFRRFFLYKN